MANEPTGWAWFCAQSSRDVRIAAHRAGVVAQVRALELIGMTRSAAVVTVAADRKIGIATIWGWLRLVNGVGHDLRAQLVELCPRPRRSKR